MQVSHEEELIVWAEGQGLEWFGLYLVKLEAPLWLRVPSADGRSPVCVRGAPCLVQSRCEQNPV